MPGLISDPQNGATQAKPKAAGDGPRGFWDLFQRLGMIGGASGTNDGSERQRGAEIFTGAALIGGVVAVVNYLNFVTDLRALPNMGPLQPLIWEGSSWLSMMLILWIPWAAFRLAPPDARPRARLLLHIPVAMAFSLAHVVGFIALRRIAYALAGSRYVFGPFGPNFLYEFSKDAVAYVLFVFSFALVATLLKSRQHLAQANARATFDIRDGARVTRIRLADILAVTAAGNYVEFALADGRRLLMRAPLSAIKAELEPLGFLRVHRSWLINPKRMTALTPQGSGDYQVALGELCAPLSRRYPEALESLRGKES